MPQHTFREMPPGYRCNNGRVMNGETDAGQCPLCDGTSCYPDKKRARIVAKLERRIADCDFVAGNENAMFSPSAVWRAKEDRKFYRDIIAALSETR